MATMREAVIVEAVRTAVGRRNGRLKDWHPVDLMAQVLFTLAQRTRIDTNLVEDVIIGCVSQVGEQSLNVGRNAALATAEGRFKSQIVPIEVKNEDGTTSMFEQDEGIRTDTSLEKLASLKPAFKPDGLITAGNSSQISDGAAAVLIMERETAEKMGLQPRARFISFSLAGDNPIMMLTAPIPATYKALKKAGLTLDQIDLVEINEAFASVVLAWQRSTGADMSRVNVNGGAVAIGHPLGASGARLTTVLLHELERTGGRYGLQTICEGGGMANAMIIEHLE